MADRAKLIGFNHVAIEVGNIEEALEFYGRLFEIELRGRGPRMAFIDAGDQFIALAEGENRSPDEHRHIGMVVDDRRVVRRALKEMGVEIMPGRCHLLIPRPPALDLAEPPVESDSLLYGVSEHLGTFLLYHLV